jgi:hypothetical protein
MTKRKPNPQRGGRKPSGNERHTVSLPPALWAHVDAQAGKTRSARLAVVVGRDMAVSEFPRLRSDGEICPIHGVECNHTIYDQEDYGDTFAWVPKGSVCPVCFALYEKAHPKPDLSNVEVPF